METLYLSITYTVSGFKVVLSLVYFSRWIVPVQM